MTFPKSTKKGHIIHQSGRDKGTHVTNQEETKGHICHQSGRGKGTHTPSMRKRQNNHNNKTPSSSFTIESSR